MTKLTENVFAVEVPEGAKDIHCEVSMSGTPYIAYKFNDDELLNEYEDIVLPPGTWQLLCTTKEATEEKARGIVGWLQIGNQMGFQDYRFDDPRFPYELATQSLNSLCKSKGLDGNKNYVLLKKM